MSERKTENLLERELKKNGFIDEDIHFQGTDDEEIKRCLPSKRSGKEGKGKPEHIIRLNGDAADILVTECKADKTFHTSSPDLSEFSDLKPVEYAEDGIIHYMKVLKKEFNVIGLAVSGTDTLEISTFKCLRGGTIERTQNKTILKREDYLSSLKNSSGYGTKSEEEIISFSRELHEYLRDNMEMSESLKPLIVSGILLGLMDTGFETSYRSLAKQDDLAEALYEGIKRTLRSKGVREEKLDAMLSNYGFIKTEIAVKENLMSIISKIYRHLFFALQPNSSIDILGHFYGEFLRYSGGDKKGLGIVLTPRHITELFADLACLDPNKSTVIDICAGTSGFLISAMAYMIAKAPNDSDAFERITKQGLIGIETNSMMFTLACANMIFRRDGKSNMFLGDCFNTTPQLAETLERLKPNVAMLNPPYSKKAKDKHELRFVKRALDLLQTNGIGIAIIPVGCLVNDSKEIVQIKKEILQDHTLKAVMSMPQQLFPKIGTVTAIAVFEAKKSHFRTVKDNNGIDQLIPRAETWFGYWRDDGFIMSKNKRVEREQGIWEKIKKEWLDSYFNQNVEKGKSWKHSVTYTDEWVAEAYMDIDYSELSKETFEKEVKKYLLYNLMLEVQGSELLSEENEDED